MDNERNSYYNGDERRKGYCPVHHVKCNQLDNTEREVKRKVPIWVFTLFLMMAGSVFGYQLYLLNDHVRNSNSILRNLSHGLREVALNQKTVMHELELTYQELHDYEKGLN